MNITEGVWHYLSDKADLMALLGTNDEGIPYFFQDDLIMTNEYLENSQKCALIVSYEGEWSSPNNTSSAQYPRIQIEIMADPDRHPDHSPVSTNNARDKIQVITDVVLRHVHRLGNFDERWGDCRVFSSTRLMMYRSRARGQEFQGVEDGNGLQSSTIYFGLITA